MLVQPGFELATFSSTIRCSTENESKPYNVNSPKLNRRSFYSTFSQQNKQPMRTATTTWRWLTALTAKNRAETENSMSYCKITSHFTTHGLNAARSFRGNHCMVARSRMNATLLHLWQPKLKESSVDKGSNYGICEQFLTLSCIHDYWNGRIEKTLTSIFSLAIKGY